MAQPVAQPAALLRPGELTKPVRVWCSSSSIRIAWYQAEPVSEQVTILYKKHGAVFGTEIVLPTMSLEGPELSVRAPLAVGGGKVGYYELDIRKLRPSTQYIVKVRAGGVQGTPGAPVMDDQATAPPPLDADSTNQATVLPPSPERQEGTAAQAGANTNTYKVSRLSTLSEQEEAKRNQDMKNFIGAMVKLGEYDGTVVAFEQGTGLYQVRILQVEESGSVLQLIRLASDYSDVGLSARTYTLSDIKFSRWGGEISRSQVISEGELRWIVGRSVQLAERSNAELTLAARESVFQSHNEQLAAQLEAQKEAALASLAFTRRTYAALFAVVAVLCLLLVGWSWRWGRQAHRLSNAAIAKADVEVEQLRQELRALQLYKVSLDLDTGAWISAAAAGSAAWQPCQPGPNRTCSSNGASDSSSGFCASPGFNTSGATCSTDRSKDAGSGNDSARPRYHPLLDFSGPLLDALRRKNGSRSDPVQGSGGASKSGTGKAFWRKWRDRSSATSDVPWKDANTWTELPRALDGVELAPEPPELGSFVEHASSLYSLYLNEWLKHQLAKSIRSNIQTLLANQAGPAAAAAEAGSEGSSGDGAAGAKEAPSRAADPPSEEVVRQAAKHGLQRAAILQHERQQQGSGRRRAWNARSQQRRTQHGGAQHRQQGKRAWRGKGNVDGGSKRRVDDEDAGASSPGWLSQVSSSAQGYLQRFRAAPPKRGRARGHDADYEDISMQRSVQDADYADAYDYVDAGAYEAY